MAEDNEERQFKFMFPPFPTVPEGKTIVPFKEYKPKGIKIVESDDEEVDGDGVRTVSLPVAHIADPEEKAAAARKKKARKRRKNEGAGFGPATKTSDRPSKYWYDDWTEDIYRERVTRLDPLSGREDRLEQIFIDFQTERRFTQEVQSLYDNFKIFMGLLEHHHQNLPGSKMAEKVKQPPPSDGTASDFADDADGSERNGSPPAAKVEPVVDEESNGSPPKKRMKMEKPVLLSTDEKMERFFDHPKETMELYFGGYNWNKGSAWSEEKRKSNPLMVEFILKFILRHRAIEDYRKEINQALEVVERAKPELLAIGVISSLLPDDFGVACAELWGRSNMLLWGSTDATSGVADPPPPAPEPESEPEPEPETDGPKVGLVTTDDLRKEGMIISSEEENQQGDVKMGEGGGTGWGAIPEGDTWGDETNEASWGANNGIWSQPEPTWELPGMTDTQKMFYNQLPNNFVKVRLERGVRRIAGVEPPDPNSAVPLRKSTGVLILAPWGNWSSKDGTWQSEPSIHLDDTSKTVTVPPHDPLTSSLRILVDPKLVEVLKEHIGMGVQGYWVQVAKGKEEGEAAKKKSKAKDSALHFWYCESLHGVLLSFFREE